MFAHFSRYKWGLLTLTFFLIVNIAFCQNGTKTTDTLELRPQTIRLNEVMVSDSKKRRKTKLIGKIQRSKFGVYLPGFKVGGKYAKFFEYDSEYEQTPYLKEIRLATRNGNEKTKIKFRLYAKSEKGEPVGYIYADTILAEVKKGKKITKIDITDLNIKFPKKGFFVAVEWLFFDKDIQVWESYYPEIGFMQLETDKNSWYYRQGQWRKIWRNTGERDDYRDKYNHLALELVLTN